MTISFEPHSLRSLQIDEDARRRYIVRYKCETTASEGAPQVRAQFDTTYPLGVTYYTDPYDSSTDTAAVRVRPFSIVPWRQGGKGSKARFWIDATFDTLGDRHCKDETFDGPPWTHPWVRSSQSTRVMKPIFDDKDGVELMNYANEPYYPAPEIEQIDDVLVFQGNLQSVPFFTWSEFKARGGAVNDAAIGPWPVRTLRIVELDWSEAFWGACQRYYQCRVAIAVNSATWDLVVEQFAFREITDSGPPIVYSNFNNGLPQPIDTDGEAADTPSTRTHKLHNEKDFSLIGFPMSLLTT